MVRIGTVGWAYEDWRGPFYAAGTRRARMLTEYARLFPTVELDATFFGFPRPTTLEGWAAQVPADFRFCAKVPKSVTHERRLQGEAADEALAFADLMQEKLGEKLGRLLIQLPPEIAPAERGTLDTFAAAVARPGIPWALELRDAAWAQTDIAAALESSGIALAASDRLDLGAPLRYVRLLGIENSVGRFDTRQFDRGAELDAWAERLRAATGEVYVVVRNFFEGHSPATVLALRERLGLLPLTPPGAQQMSLF